MAAVSGRRIGNRLITNPRKSSGPGATVTQFPVLARRAFIARIAAAMRRKRSDDAAETYLAGELRRYRRDRQAQGIPSTIIKQELHALEPAVRGELWRLIFGPLSGTGRRR